jgi:hypothetical protein
LPPEGPTQTALAHLDPKTNRRRALLPPVRAASRLELSVRHLPSCRRKQRRGKAGRGGKFAACEYPYAREQYRSASVVASPLLRACMRVPCTSVSLAKTFASVVYATLWSAS